MMFVLDPQGAQEGRGEHDDMIHRFSRDADTSIGKGLRKVAWDLVRGQERNLDHCLERLEGL